MTATSTARPGAAVTRWVAYGRPAMQGLEDAVAAAKVGDPLRPVTVVVPSKVSGLGLRRAFASRPGGTVGVAFVVLDQLAEQLAAPRVAASGRRPLTPHVRAEVVRETLRRVPGGLGDLAVHPATARVLDDAFADLRQATATGGEDDLLAELRRHGGLRTTLADTFRMFRDLTAPTRYDEHDLALLAAEAATSDVGALDHVGPVVVHLPTRVSPSGVHLLRALARATPVTVLLGRTGDPRADAVTATLGRRLAGSGPDLPDGDPVDRAEVGAIVAPDAEEEVREAARIVASALHAGQDLSRIAVLFRAPRPYATLVHELFDAAELPHNGPTERLVRQTMAGRFLDDLWSWADRGTPRSELFDVLGSVPVRWRGARVPDERWDRLARQARVLGGVSHWDGRLAGFARTCAAQREHEDRAWLQERLRADEATATELREFVLELTDALAAPDPATWTAWSRWALHLLDTYLGSGRAGWPPADVDAEGDLRQQLTALAQLDDLPAELGIDPHPVTPDEARAAIAMVLDQPAGRVGRAGTGVYVGPIGTAGVLDVDHVVVLGAVEGQFPPTARGNVLLPDDVVDGTRQDGTGTLAEVAAALPTGADRVDAARQALHRVVAGAARATFTVPRADRREQRARVPAPWLLDLLGDRAGRRVGVADVLGTAPPAGVRAVASRVAGLRGAATAAGVDEHRLRLLSAHLADGHDLADAALVADSPVLATGIEVSRRRRGGRLTAFDGHVTDAEPALRARLEQPHAPAALADYATCPRRYLFTHVLRVQSEEEPRRWLDVDALDRGVLVHDTLERWVAETLDGGPDAPAGARPAGSDDRLFELLEQGFAELEERGRIGVPQLWEYEKGRIRRRLAVWRDQDRALRERHGVSPDEVELAFGMGDGDPVEVATDIGVTLRLRGKIDRIDASADGSTAIVTDYKTSRPGTYSTLAEDIAQAGTELQLPVYGLAAARAYPDAELHVGYWHVHDDVRPDREPVLVAFDGAARARTQQVLDTIARGVTDGVFVASPGGETLWPAPTFHNCRHCDFDPICPSHAERARAAERDLSSDAARVLLPLWDPAAGDDPDEVAP